MNKKYIKRQIVLHKLGLPIEEDIKEYYDYFNNLIGNINDLEELSHEDYPNSIFWRKEGEVILEYELKNEYFWASYGIIWKKFNEKYSLIYNSISELLSALLEDVFKLRVTTTLSHSYIFDLRINKL